VSHDKQDITASYDAAAQGFARLADPQVYSHLAKPLAASLRQVSGTLLDVASGTGALGRLFEDAVAADISHQQLLMNPLSLKVRADAEELPFEDDSFAASACAFGINHFPRPDKAVREMARVSRLVALGTWLRPEDPPYAPKETLLMAIEHHCGRQHSPTGEAVERMTSNVGSEGAMRRLLASAGLNPRVWTTSTMVPWPGTEAFVDYRLAMMGSLAPLANLEILREDAIAAIEALPPESLLWHPKLVLGIGS
jgi:SAM-dependent methyltransferase